MMTTCPALSFIILIWNSERFLVRCLDSVAEKCAHEGIPHEIIAIDNGSSDRSPEIVSRYSTTHPDIFHVISLEKNCGTTFPRNLGLKRARGDYLCILDSDTEVREGDLSTILDRLDTDPRIGLIAPRLLLPDRTVQHSVKHFPTMLQKLSKLPSILLGTQARNSDFYDDFPFQEERLADSAISACWFLTRKTMKTVGEFDENIFYSPEDLDYSMRVWKAGLAILYYPHFTVIHHTQQLSHRKVISWISLSHLMGLLYYYRKHGGWLFNPDVGAFSKG